ncbi:lasso peptide biosynthesis PqqD family chaperone [Allorhizocola rhizosphaerae]|uniref:lasso peptide biosynthesis PqqD family chaperone n=1 Tax=Allorhizocola rhizosphaerae TaxID=1872709 RepID=UPI000E3E54D4|nr:lasso peptide biosynthesis PqqD family chaperone [Allorhizocola rhizosphaerae]
MNVRLGAGVSYAATEYGSVLLDSGAGEYFQLNPSGTVALRQLLDGRTPAEAAGALADEFDVDPAQAEQDVLTLVESLRTARLVTVTS